MPELVTEKDMERVLAITRRLYEKVGLEATLSELAALATAGSTYSLSAAIILGDYYATLCPDGFPGVRPELAMQIVLSPP